MFYGHEYFPTDSWYQARDPLYSYKSMWIFKPMQANVSASRDSFAGWTPLNRIQLFTVGGYLVWNLFNN